MSDEFEGPRMFNFRCTDGFLEKLDKWRRQQPGRIPSASQAARTLVLKAIEADELATEKMEHRT
jgi:hypothetical protein